MRTHTIILADERDVNNIAAAIHESNNFAAAMSESNNDATAAWIGKYRNDASQAHPFSRVIFHRLGRLW